MDNTSTRVSRNVVTKDYQLIYSPTTNDMVQVMHQALNAEYEVKIDTLTTTKSNYENIYQFAVDMVRKKDNHSVTVAGSYSEEMNQIQFSILVGNIQIQH